MNAQCILLWRLRFEETSSFDRIKRREQTSLCLRPAALNWPWNGSADDAAWAGYVLVSLHASIEVVNKWSQRAALISDADIYGQDKARAMALYTDFAALLSPMLLPVLPRITVLMGAIQDDNQDRSIIVVGPGAFNIQNKK